MHLAELLDLCDIHGLQFCCTGPVEVNVLSRWGCSHGHQKATPSALLPPRPTAQQLIPKRGLNWPARCQKGSVQSLEALNGPGSNHIVGGQVLRQQPESDLLLECLGACCVRSIGLPQPQCRGLPLQPTQDLMARYSALASQGTVAHSDRAEGTMLCSQTL